ncbi:ATP-dependent RNA helicase [Candidatus Saccharibacteria bacterium TM7i]|nr:ATP-dependent RNA helicase [Candidatus Saccharibacteria bacterium TM7i]
MKDTSRFVDLPVRDFYETITQAVDENQVTIVTAETGAGKSTQIPQYLAEHGYSRVIVTQPRILAARNLSKRVREEWAERNTEDSSQIIGYRTAHERDDSGRTQILYCTDGLQLVRELTGIGTLESQVLVLDEVHEWNENMEVLVAWAKKRAEEEPLFKVLIMSATFDEQSLAEYFNATAVLKIPGRHFPVTKRTGKDLLQELFLQLENPGRNILTFLPGKAEIQATAEALASKAEVAGVPILPLHSQLEAEDQQKVFGSYPNGKIILSTNIAQTSITIDDIDMVVDSGLERRSEVRSGVEGLFISQISQADCEQRAGRAGRTKPGEYVLAPFDTMPCLSFEERPEYPTPEILRKHIDRLTLRLASIGIDIEMLDFYHDPSKKAIRYAKYVLRALGALTNGGEVTNIGRAMERFPVESTYARMLVAADEYPDLTKSQLATIIAIQEIGGIIKGGASVNGWRAFTKQKKSDLLAQYDVYRSLPLIHEEAYEETGIIAKNVEKAREVVERLHRDLGLTLEEPVPIDADSEKLLMQAIVAGQIHQLWFLDDHGNYEHVSTGQKREASSSTVLQFAKLVSGTPFDLQIPTRSGGLEVLNLLQGMTVVDVDWLLTLAPEQFTAHKTRLTYDHRLAGLAEIPVIKLGKRSLTGESRPIMEHTRYNEKMFQQEFTRWVFAQLEKQRINLERFHKKVPHVPRRFIEAEIHNRTQGIVSLHEVESRVKRELFALAQLDTYLTDADRAHLSQPERRWRPTRKFGKHDRSRRRDTAPKHEHRRKHWSKYRGRQD